MFSLCSLCYRHPCISMVVNMHAFIDPGPLAHGNLEAIKARLRADLSLTATISAGMAATEAVIARSRRSGMAALEPQQGLDALAALLAAAGSGKHLVQVAVVPADWGIILKQVCCFLKHFHFPFQGTPCWQWASNCMPLHSRLRFKSDYVCNLDWRDGANPSCRHVILMHSAVTAGCCRHSFLLSRVCRRPAAAARGRRHGAAAHAATARRFTAPAATRGRAGRRQTGCRTAGPGGRHRSGGGGSGGHSGRGGRPPAAAHGGWPGLPR